MFGHAAPVIPGRNAPGPAPGGFAPPQQQGFAAPQPGQPARPAGPGPQGATIMGGPPNMQPPAPGRPPGQPGFPPQQQGGYPPPGQPQNFGGQPGFPPPQQPQGYPPPGQPNFGPPPGQPPQMGGQPGFGPPPGQPNFGPPPGQPGFGPPPGQPNFGPPPGQPPQMGGQPGFGPPPGQPQGYPPPGQPNFGPPPGQHMGQPMGGPPMGGGYPPPGQPPMGGPQPGFGPPPGGPPGMGGQPGFPPPQPQYPAAGGFGVAPQQDLPGPIDNIARGLPQSAPGTILGIPVAKMLEPGLQRTVLFFAGIALLVSIVVPVSISPLIFPFSGEGGMGFFQGLLLPAIIGGGYLLVAAAPAEMRQKLPPIVIQWMPFGLSLWGVYTFFGPIFFGGAAGTFAYVFLVFGLLSRIMKPNDSTARVVIAIGAGLMVLMFLHFLSPFGGLFGGGIFNIIVNMINLLVAALGILCVTMVLPPQKVPPALRALDALGPLICAVLLVWPVVNSLLVLIGGLIHGEIIVGLLVFARLLLYLVSFIGVLLMTSPPVYDQVTGVNVLRRTPLGTLAMCLVPLFGVYWIVETKEYLKKKSGMDLPSGWWLAVPLYGPIMFLWKWSQAMEKVTGLKQMNIFLFMLFISPYGVWVSQQKFNELEGVNPPSAPPQQQAGGGYPPQGGGYPPQGGGYPPPGGGYPPPGGGYPPPGGGYPPPGGGYPA
jgi:hypothetical protein